MPWVSSPAAAFVMPQPMLPHAAESQQFLSRAMLLPAVETPSRLKSEKQAGRWNRATWVSWRV